MQRLFLGLFLVGLIGLSFILPAQAADGEPPLPYDTSIFVEPTESELISRLWYGRLADFTDVYAAPGFENPIVRNVGDGYLYASLMRTQEVNGQKWYQINPNEWVSADNITLANPSTFQGFEIAKQPERPFGWIVIGHIRPSSEPGGEPNPEFDRLYRYTFFEVLDAEKDADDWIWYRVDDERWIRQTEVSIVDVSPRPRDVPRDGFWTEVDLYEQTFAAYEGDRMVYASLISSGLNRWPTREGIFQVEEQFPRVKMSGAEGKVDYYFVEDVPHTMFFDMKLGIALHGAYWHDRFGYKHSHGCVNMPPLDSEWVYNWSQDADDSLWVWVHTSDPTSIFRSSHHGKLAPEHPQIRINRGMQLDAY
jgi:hypothetical protein